MFKHLARIPLLFVLITTICYQNQPVWSYSKEPFTIGHRFATTTTNNNNNIDISPTTTSYRDHTIGCLYSNVCNQDQVCFDDNAFGRCEHYDQQSGSFESDYTYQLDKKTIQLLEQELMRLTLDGFDWPDPYTQCIVKTILNDRPRIVYDPKVCDDYYYIIDQQQTPFTENNVKTGRQIPFEDHWITPPINEDNSQNDDNQNIFKSIERTLSKYLIDSPSTFIRQTPTTTNNRQQENETLNGKTNKQQEKSTSTSKITLNNLNKESLPLSVTSSSPSSSSTSFNPSSSSTSSSSSSTSTNTNNKSISSKTIDNDKQQQQSRSDISRLMSKLRERHNGFLFSQDNNGDSEQILLEQPLATEMMADKKKKSSSSRKLLDSESNLFDDSNLIDINEDEFNERNKNLVDYLRLLIEQEDNNKNNDNDNSLFMDNYLLKDDRAYRTNNLWDAFQQQESSPLKKFSDDNLGSSNDFPWKKYRQSQPFISIFKVPEVRVIRDTADIDDKVDNMKTLLDLDDQDGPQLTLIDSPINEDFILVDLDDDRDQDEDAYNNDDNQTEDLDNDLNIQNALDMNLLNKIFNGKLIITDDEDDDNKFDENGIRNPQQRSFLFSEDANNLIDDKNQETKDHDDDNDGEDDVSEAAKEILLGDINYSNNYMMPNFYRNHRYDIKKPGPIYWENHFMESSSTYSPKNNLKTKYQQKQLQQQKSNLNKEKPMEDNNKNVNLTAKKEFSIRSNQPVAEGPVKVDSKSENSLIIRTAEEGERTNLEAIDSTHTYIVTDKMLGEEDSERFLQTIEQVFNLPRGTFSNLRKEDYQITFKVNPNYLELNASQVASRIEDSADLIKDITGYMVRETGIGDKTKLPVISAIQQQHTNERLIRMTLLVCTIVFVSIAGAFIVFMFRRNNKFREKIKGFMKLSEDWIKFDYQELCRQRFQNKNAKNNGKEKDLEKKDSQDSKEDKEHNQQGTTPPSRSSTSSWVEEPVSSNMDITTGHIILSYMEDHLKKKDRLDREWEALCAYEADPCSTTAASQKQNANKNRYPNILPYDHSRVILNDSANASNSDYINANTITDHDPRNPAYIATQGPMPNTKADFWQMIWESGTVLIVMLTRLRENGLNMCDRYWPEEGSEMFQNYEVHLVSEHIWCDDYLVRSFYLKNLKTGETRTVTQFHFLSWPENGVPPNIKSMLEFRRKVNKSYKGRSCPIVVHCSDGVGRTGTYILIDMVLNRLAKGAKEIDLAASLEHIRDQRCGMVKTKAQFEFVLCAVADEVQAILKAFNN